MNAMLRLMQVIYSSWIVSADEESDPGSIPSGPGVLDYALYDLVQRRFFPAWVREELHFVESATGLTCLEVPQIQKLATEAKMTSDPNPSYTRSEVQVSKKAAKYLLARLGIVESDAKKWGVALRDALLKAEQQLEPVRA